MSDELDFQNDIGVAPPAVLSAAWLTQRVFLWLNRASRVLVVATIALVGWGVLQQLDLGLTRMHVNDAKSYGPSALVGPSLTFPKPWASAIDTWDKYQVQLCRSAPPEGMTPTRCSRVVETSSLSPREALFRHVIVDTVFFMFPSAFLLWFLLWRAWRRARPSPAVVGPLQQVLALTLVLPAVVLLFDALENLGILVITWRWTDGVGGIFVGVVSALTLVKWLCVYLIVIVLAIVTVRLYYEPGSKLRSDLGHAIRRVVALRAQLIAAGSITLLLGLSVFSADLGNQLLDVLVRWLEHWGTGVLAFVGLVVLTAVLVVTGRCSLRDYDGTGTTGTSMSAWTAIVLGGVGVVLIVGGGVWPDHRWALLPTGIALVLFGLLSAPDGVRNANPLSISFANGGGWVYPFLVAVPAWVFAILLTRAAVTLAFQQGGGRDSTILTLLCAVAGIIAIVGGYAAHRYETWQPSTVDTVVTVGVTVSAALMVAVGWVVGILDPLRFGVDVGALAIVGLFATGLCLVFFGLTTLGNHWRAKGPLAVLQFRRVPVVTFVVVFIVAGSALDTDARMHDVRLQGALTATSQPVKLAAAWKAWVDALPDDGRPVPMVFVASTGGGIRAAYWTTAAMGCLFGFRPPSNPDGSADACAKDANVDAQRVFAASGISGGSLGLVAEFAARPDDATERLRRDFVSPVISQLLLVDTPNAVVRLDDVDDRAVVLEHAWEDAWSDQAKNPLKQDLFSWQRDHLGTKPVLLLNGATVEDGCRMAATALDTAVTAPNVQQPALPLSDRSCTSLTPFLTGPTGSGTADPSLVRTTSLYDLSCGASDEVHHDVALSTAALLSARFPVVSPTGGLYHCGTKGDGDRNARLSDVDGGAIETSGAKPLEEVFAQLAPMVAATNAQRTGQGDGCIRPRLILLDNNYVSSARTDPAGHQLESQLLLQAKGIGGKGLTAAARQEAALAFDHFFAGTCGSGTSTTAPSTAPDGSAVTQLGGGGAGAACTDSVAYIVPSEHPGVRAPLGWTLSNVSADDMDAQLTKPRGWNAGQLALARSWFARDAC